MSDKVQLRLLKENLPEFKYNDEYHFISLNLSTVDFYSKEIKEIISYHYEDIDWDGIPDYQTVKDRLAFGSRCHLWMHNSQCLGWHWTNGECITYDWVTCAKELKPNELYGGGAFLSKKNKPHASSAYYFYRQGIEYSILLHRKEVMYLYADSWNRASTQLSYKCGFKPYNFVY